MVAIRTQQAINGVVWSGSGFAVILVRLFLYQGVALLGWLILGSLMIVVGLYQFWRFQKSKEARAETLASSSIGG